MISFRFVRAAAERLLVLIAAFATLIPQPAKRQAFQRDQRGRDSRFEKIVGSNIGFSLIVQSSGRDFEIGGWIKRWR